MEVTRQNNIQTAHLQNKIKEFLETEMRRHGGEEFLELKKGD